MKRENTAFRDRSKYPAKLLFRPALVRSLRIYPYQILARLKGILHPDIPPTEQELDYRRRMGGKPSGDRLGSADIASLSDWSQKGAFWVRKADGAYAQCHMDQRAGAHALWRDHAESYCCAGFPYFSPEHVRKMQGGMEVFKPLLRVEVSSARIEFALARSIADPHGNCWGLSTLREWLEMRSWDALEASPGRWDGWGEASEEEIIGRLKSIAQTIPCKA